jgi:hypothetical protein
VLQYGLSKIGIAPHFATAYKHLEAIDDVIFGEAEVLGDFRGGYYLGVKLVRS